MAVAEKRREARSRADSLVRLDVPNCRKNNASLITAIALNLFVNDSRIMPAVIRA